MTGGTFNDHLPFHFKPQMHIFGNTATRQETGLTGQTRTLLEQAVGLNTKTRKRKQLVDNWITWRINPETTNSMKQKEFDYQQIQKTQQIWRIKEELG